MTIKLVFAKEAIVLELGRIGGNSGDNNASMFDTAATANNKTKDGRDPKGGDREDGIISVLLDNKYRWILQSEGQAWKGIQYLLKYTRYHSYLLRCNGLNLDCSYLLNVCSK